MKELADERESSRATEHAVADALQELIALFGAASEGAWLRAMQRAGITAPQMITLNVLAREGAKTVSALAERLRLTRGTVSHLVDRLVRMRLVTREEAADDRRQKRVELAPTGRRLLGELRGERHADFAHAAALLTPQTRDALVSALGAATREVRAYLDARKTHGTTDPAGHHPQGIGAERKGAG